MKYEVIISEIAEIEISDVYIWYSNQQLNLGARFKKILSKTIYKISKNPSAFQNRYKHIKIAFLYKFPYGIHYDVNENIITIISVFHTSRKPKK